MFLNRARHYGACKERPKPVKVEPSKYTMPPREPNALKRVITSVNAIVSNIKCNSCGNILPPHTMRQHVDKTHQIHNCPHVMP